MKQLLTLLAMSWTCLSACAQISSEEAMAKLKSKEAAATQPSDPSQDFRALKTEVEMLRLQQMALAAQVKELQKQLAILKAPEATTNPTAKSNGDWKSQLKLGMSEDDADLVFVGMKHVIKKVVAVTEVKKTVIWVQTISPGSPSSDDSPSTLAKMSFIDGKATSIMFP